MPPIMHAVTSSLPQWSGELFASPADVSPLALVPLGLCAGLAVLLAIARRAGSRPSRGDRREARTWRRAA